MKGGSPALGGVSVAGGRLAAAPLFNPSPRLLWYRRSSARPATPAPGLARALAAQPPNPSPGRPYARPRLYLGQTRRGWRPCGTYAPAKQFGSLDEGDSAAAAAGHADQGPPLTVEQLKRLTELDVGNVYDLGVVGGPEELAARLGTSLTAGLTSDEVREWARLPCARSGCPCKCWGGPCRIVGDVQLGGEQAQEQRTVFGPEG